MSRESMLKAYEMSRRYEARNDMEYEMYGRDRPFGGVAAVIKNIGNLVWRYPSMLGAGLFGSSADPESVKLLETPENLKGGNLEKAFQEAWQYKLESIKEDKAGMEHLLNGNIGKWYAQEHKADFNRKKKDIALPATSSTLGLIAGIGMFAGVRYLGHKMMREGVTKEVEELRGDKALLEEQVKIMGAQPFTRPVETPTTNHGGTSKPRARTAP